MQINITCFKESGKYYADNDVTVPDMAIDTEQGPLINTHETRDYVLAHPDLWPVTDLDNFHTIVTLIKDGTRIAHLPLMIPAGFQKTTKAYVPISA